MIDPDAYVSARCNHEGRYPHQNSMRVSVEIDSAYEDAHANAQLLEEYLTEKVKEISKALEKTGYAEIEYCRSEEYLTEVAHDNWEFYRNGEVVRA